MKTFMVTFYSSGPKLVKSFMICNQPCKHFGKFPVRIISCLVIRIGKWGVNVKMKQIFRGNVTSMSPKTVDRKHLISVDVKWQSKIILFFFCGLTVCFMYISFQYFQLVLNSKMQWFTVYLLQNTEWYSEIRVRAERTDRLVNWQKVSRQHF